MYEEEFNKNKKLKSKIKELELEIYCLNSKLNISNSKMEKEIEKVITPLKNENNKLKNDLSNAYEEIDRLKSQIENNNIIESNIDKDFIIDKLTNQLNKDSSNSGIPTSKEIKTKNNKTHNTECESYSRERISEALKEVQSRRHDLIKKVKFLK